MLSKDLPRVALRLFPLLFLAEHSEVTAITQAGPGAAGANGRPLWHPQDAGFAGMRIMRAKGSWWLLLKFQRQARQSCVTALVPM